MTHHTPKRRPYRRRSRKVFVTTTRRDGSPEAIARVVTTIALSGAQREAEARADHHARLARASAFQAPMSQPVCGEAGDA